MWYQKELEQEEGEAENRTDAIFLQLHSLFLSLGLLNSSIVVFDVLLVCFASRVEAADIEKKKGNVFQKDLSLHL